MNHKGTVTMFANQEPPKVKLVLEFNSKAEREAWLAAYYNSGEQEMMEAFDAIGNDFPEIKISEI